MKRGLLFLAVLIALSLACSSAAEPTGEPTQPVATQTERVVYVPVTTTPIPGVTDETATPGIVGVPASATPTATSTPDDFQQTQLDKSVSLLPQLGDVSYVGDIELGRDYVQSILSEILHCTHAFIPESAAWWGFNANDMSSNYDVSLFWKVSEFENRETVISFYDAIDFCGYQPVLVVKGDGYNVLQYESGGLTKNDEIVGFGILIELQE